MTLKQAGYEWLWDEPGPKMLLELLKLYGVHEVPGPGNSMEIMGWAHEAGLVYAGDAEAWCGLGQSISAKRAGWLWKPAGNPLWARNWATWGQARVGPAMLGDILVFPRGTGGHVAQYVGEDDPSQLPKGAAPMFHILGANQGDAVDIVRHPMNAIALRHAPWTVQPPNVRRIFLSPHGARVSTKEA